MRVTKVTVAEIADVLNNNWPGEDWFMEDCGEAYDEEKGYFTNDDDGRYVPKNPDELVNLRDFDFAFAWQGEGPEQRSPGSFVALFKKVHKAKDSVTVVYEVSKAALADFEEYAAKLGAKRIK